MKTFVFDVVLQDAGEPTDALADGLYASGCDDGTLAARDGVTWMHFYRQAPSLEEAIRTAVAQIRATGLTVAKIELEAAAAEAAVNI
jgi:hypothetical protein